MRGFDIVGEGMRDILLKKNGEASQHHEVIVLLPKGLSTFARNLGYICPE